VVGGDDDQGVAALFGEGSGDQVAIPFALSIKASIFLKLSSWHLGDCGAPDARVYPQKSLK
jgi:hypothetical protein